MKWKSCQTDPLPKEVGDRILVMWMVGTDGSEEYWMMAICELEENGVWVDEEGVITSPIEEGRFWVSEQDVVQNLKEAQCIR